MQIFLKKYFFEKFGQNIWKYHLKVYIFVLILKNIFMATIQTKFDVHDLIMHKYSYGTDEGSVTLFEVIDVKGHKCYGGTQCFVSCRGIRIQYKNNYPLKQEQEVEHIAVAVYRNEDYPQFKEDEMIFAPTEYIELIQKHTNS